MRKSLLGFLILTLVAPIPSQAAKTIPYKNQKAGQFCKSLDVKKKVVLPDGRTLTCTKDGSRARWKA
jgi:hypothetical protein